MSQEIEVTLPKLGESIMNATVVQWFKKEGERVAKDEPLLEVATDKVNSEIPSPSSGILKKIHAAPDQELTVGDLLATLAQEGANAQPEKVEKVKEKAPQEATEDRSGYYSPALLRLAKENGIPLDELEKISGTGSGGRISKKDLEEYIAKRTKPCPHKVSKPKAGVELVKLGGLRKAISEAMVRSVSEIPHATLVAEVDVTPLMQRIERDKRPFFEKHGVKLTITSFVAQAITKALKEYPWLNGTLNGDTLEVKHFVNLGVAVSVEQGVMVPVIRGLDQLTLAEIAAGVADISKKTRTNTLHPDDVQEGTITLTNFGMSGVQIGIPIIRHPEVAIIGIGGITKRVVPLDEDQFGVRKMMHVSLTFDHRVIDGMYGCGFLGVLKGELEGETDPSAAPK